MDEIRFRRVQSSHRNNDARKIFLFPLFYYTHVYIIRVYMYTHTHVYISFFFTSTPSEKAHARTEERAGSLDRETSDEGWFILRAGSQQSGTDRDCRVTIHCNIFKHNISATDRRNNCICAHYTVLPVIPRWRFNAWSTVFHVSVIFNV